MSKKKKTYEVKIVLQPIIYEIEAKDEEQAAEYAEELIYDETMYDLVKWADYKVEEITDENSTTKG